MFCNNCGREIEDGAKFCDYCGSPVNYDSVGKTAPESSFSAYTEELAPATEQKQSPKKLLIIAGCVIIVAVVIIAVFMILGGKTEESTEQTPEATKETTKQDAEKPRDLSPEQLNEQMIGVWLPAEGIEDDNVTFLYSSDSGYSSDPSGQLCIQVGYAKTEGGGISSVDYEYEDSELHYTTFDSDYNAGGEIQHDWTIEVEKLLDGKATINGVAYEKVTGDPKDGAGRAKEIIDSRYRSLLTGEWEGFDGMVNFKLNKDGTMHYGDTSMSVDGTWEPSGGMLIALKYINPYTDEEECNYYHYSSDEDYLEGRDMNQGRFDRK